MLDCLNENATQGSRFLIGTASPSVAPCKRPVLALLGYVKALYDLRLLENKLDLFAFVEAIYDLPHYFAQSHTPGKPRP
jgi:hypothetical protein